jgi:hypothetical protein
MNLLKSVKGIIFLAAMISLIPALTFAQKAKYDLGISKSQIKKKMTKNGKTTVYLSVTKLDLTSFKKANPGIKFEQVGDQVLMKDNGATRGGFQCGCGVGSTGGGCQATISGNTIVCMATSCKNCGLVVVMKNSMSFKDFSN